LRANGEAALLGLQFKLHALECTMNQPQRVDPAANAKPILDEADIGSGEKTPAQRETEEMIRQIPPLPPAGQQQPQQQQQQQSGQDPAQRQA
jgi:hypothetical protein